MKHYHFVNEMKNRFNPFYVSLVLPLLVRDVLKYSNLLISK
jgi:hypothetical protein